MAQAYPALRRNIRTQTPKPRKTIRRGLPANQNLRNSRTLTKGAGALGALGRRGLVASIGGVGVAALVLWELYELTQPDLQQPGVPGSPGVPAQPGGWNFTGWTLQPTQCNVPGTGMNSSSGIRTCGSLGTTTLSTWNANENEIVSTLIPPNRRYEARMYQTAVNGSGAFSGTKRWTYACQYRLTLPSTDPAPAFPYDDPVPAVPEGQAVQMPVELPYLLPTLDPFSVPPLAPPITPWPLPYKALPYRKLNPYRAPSERRQAGNDAPLPWNFPPRTEPQVPPSGLPYVAPPFAVGVGSPATKLDTFHTQRPPGRNEKEAKIRTSGPIGKLVTAAAGGLTEAIDTVEALYDALPYEAKLKYKNTRHLLRSVSPRQMLETLWEHWDEVNIVQAGYNLVTENVEDYIYGSIGRAHVAVAKQHGWNVTLQQGGAYRRYLQQKVSRDSEESKQR